MIPAEPSLALFTDLYELAMAQAFWKSRTTGSATFSLFFRNLPPDRGYLVSAGLEAVLDYLERFRFTNGDINYLSSLKQFDERFLDYLSTLRFTGDVRAVPEGTLIFQEEPVLEITGPIVEAQLVETFALNQVHFQTVLASKAARARYAAGKKQVIDFGARRCHGVEAADLAARVGYMVGFDGTSNMMAAAHYGIPANGTMAHSFICAFPTEAEAFRSFAETFPEATTLLVDTYDTMQGVRKALNVAADLRQKGHKLRAVRLDSGDLLTLSKETRKLADEAGFPDLKIFASGGLDEFEISRLVQAGAPFDAFGVGTKVGVSAEAPHADSVYKLVQYANRPVLKLSANKQTSPGPKQVLRYYDSAGLMTHDAIACSNEIPDGAGRPLLTTMMKDGKRLGQPVSLKESRTHFSNEFARLPERYKALRSPEHFPVRISEELDRLTRDVVAETKRREF